MEAAATTVETAASHAPTAMGGLGWRRQREHRCGRSRDGAVPQDIHDPDQDNLRVRRLLAFTKHSNSRAPTPGARTGSVNTRKDTSKALFGGVPSAKMNGAQGASIGAHDR